MATHYHILTADGQNKTCRRRDFFLERNLFVTGNLVRLFQFSAKARKRPSRLGFAVLLENRVLRFFDERWKVCADAVGNTQHQFQCRIAKAMLDEAQHGFGNARTLRDGVIGKFPAFALLSQEPDNFIANGFVVADTRHAEAWQERRFDIYFAIVKTRRWLESGLWSKN